jgi:hypothetical protein
MPITHRSEDFVPALDALRGRVDALDVCNEPLMTIERPGSDLTTYDLHLRALSDFPTCDRGRLAGGLASLEQAIERDQN